MKKLTDISFTAVNSGPYVVYVDGEEYSRHTSERVAASSAVTALIENPDSEVIYHRDYTVRVRGRFEEQNKPADPEEKKSDRPEPEVQYEYSKPSAVHSFTTEK